MTYKPTPFNLTDGIWRDDDPSARYAIRSTYRRESRRYGRDDARRSAMIVAVALADYESHKRWGGQP